MPKVPLTSEAEDKTTAPMFNSPLTLLTIPVPRENNVVEPVVATEKRLAPLVEAILKIGRVWLAVEATT
jgi:hypothetical protein